MSTSDQEIQKEARLREVAGLFLARWKQHEIAKHFGVGQQQISTDIAELKKRWRLSGIVDTTEAMFEELARLDVIEMEAWDAWRRSIGKKKRTVIVRKRPAELSGDTPPEWSDTIEETETIWQDAGDPRFLEIVIKCVQKRFEAFGWNAPKKHEVWHDLQNFPTRESMYAAIAERLQARTGRMLSDGTTLAHNGTN
ncbi:MAG: hypothetical protein KGL39_42470 [Patescibacteria group bacterium]|nr:hypothetical protein [Patescibacteria group bacterium]